MPSRKPTQRPSPARGRRRGSASTAASGQGGGPGGQGGVRRPRFTQRMAVLVLVVGVLVISYASSMRAYLDQRSHLAELRSQIAQTEQDISELEREKRRWDDDAYVEAQARERFGWVMPGETSYQVIGRDGEPLQQTDDLPDPGSVPEELPEAWWSKVWGSLEAADHPERVRTPATQLEAPAPAGDR